MPLQCLTTNQDSRGMNDASAGCNPNGCHALGLNNQTGKFVNGYFDGFVQSNQSAVTKCDSFMI